MVRRLPPVPSTRDIIGLYRLTALKHLSQNFLLDGNIVRRLLKCAGSLKDCNVVEVGPGPGSITREILMQRVKSLHVIEKDRRFLPVLDMFEAASEGSLTIHHGDVLDFDTGNIFPDSVKQPWDGDFPNTHLIGNLPFNVSTPLISKYIREISLREGIWGYGRTKLTLTFQKEVGQRMVAKVGGAQRSRLSIMTQNWCHVTMPYQIPGRCFVPPPEVDVAVIHMVPKNAPYINHSYELVSKVVLAVFQYRQKHIWKGLKTLFPHELGDSWKLMVEQADVNPHATSQFLTLNHFRSFCNVYASLCEQHRGLFEYDFRGRRAADAQTSKYSGYKDSSEMDNDGVDGGAVQTDSSRSEGFRDKVV